MYLREAEYTTWSTSRLACRSGESTSEVIRQVIPVHACSPWIPTEKKKITHFSKKITHFLLFSLLFPGPTKTKTLTFEFLTVPQKTKVLFFAEPQKFNVLLFAKVKVFVFVEPGNNKENSKKWAIFLEK